MKKIYCVRHGESEGNVGPIRQTALTSLTQKGRDQSTIIAERVAKLPIEVILSSTMNRARETTEIVKNKVVTPVEYSDLFAERRRPSIVLGKPKNDPAVRAAEREIRKRFSEPGFRFSDEENFDDLKLRAKQALEYLARRKEKEILIVTHGYFMRVIVATIVFGDSLTSETCERFIQTFFMENTGITVLCHDRKEPKPWWVWIWNDHAHLG